MSYLTEVELNKIGFKSLGKNVKISSKASIYDAEKIEIGDNSRIDDFAVLAGNIKIGRNVLIGLYNNLAGGKGGIILEDFVTLAYSVNIFTQSDDYSGLTMTNSTIPSLYKREQFGKVHIGKHSIIGTNSVVMPNAHLAEGTAIGAMTLVIKPTIPWSIYIGIPAKKIKDRSKKLLELEKEFLLVQAD